MAKFEELNDNIMSVLMKVISSQNLCKLIQYNSMKPLLEKDLNKPSDLLFKKIFPLPKSPTTLDKDDTLLTIVFDDIRIGRDNIGFKGTSLCFNILCHIDNWKMDDAIRPYSIMCEIDKLFNNQKVIGIGKVQFERAKLIAANDKYFGYRLDYNVVDFR